MFTVMKIFIAFLFISVDKIENGKSDEFQLGTSKRFHLKLKATPGTCVLQLTLKKLEQRRNFFKNGNDNGFR